MTAYKEKEFLKSWVAYEIAKEFRIEAENHNSLEQQAYIQPLFEKAFPELTAKGITYNESWICDEVQDEISEWEKTNEIDEFCSSVVAKNWDKITEYSRLEREAETLALNCALDMFEQDCKTKLTAEQMNRFREKINAEGWTQERQDLVKCIQNYVGKIRCGQNL